MTVTVINKELIDNVVLELHNKGYSAARIGLHLRNQYFIKANTRLTRMYPFLEDAELEQKKLKIKAERLKAHVQKHKKDFKAERSYTKNKSTLYHAGVKAEKRVTEKNKYKNLITTT